MFTRIVIALLLISAMLIPCGPALADTAPDTLTIHAVLVSRNLEDPGDVLFTVHYEIAWDAPGDYPDDPSDETHLVQLMSTSGSLTLAATTPYPYYNNGYAEGVVSFYFTPDEVNILGITWDHQYTVRLTSKLGWISPVVKYDYTLADTDYCPSVNQGVNRSYLKAWVIDSAQSIATDWGLSTALTTVSITTVLSETGEVYFLRVIPGLRYLCPDLFTLTIFCPDDPNEGGTPTHDQTLRDRSQYEGTWVGDAIEALDDLSDGNSTFMLNVFAIGVIVVLMVRSRNWLPQRTARPGMLLGLYTLPIGAELRFTELTVVGFIALLYTMFVAKILFWDKG